MPTTLLRGVTFWIGAITTSVNANLITNGSFESPDVATNTCSDVKQIGDASITGWVVTRGSIDHCEIWQAADGPQAIDLDGANNNRGGVKQLFPTVVGGVYQVTFSLAGNPGLPVVKAMRVEAAGQGADFLFDTTSTSFENMGWATHTWVFTAIDTETALEFYSTDSLVGCGACANGPALDNVVVTQVGTVPAVSDWGMATLVLLLLVSGSLLLNKGSATNQ